MDLYLFKFCTHTLYFAFCTINSYILCTVSVLCLCLFVLSSFSLICLWSSPHRLARPFPYSNIVVETFPSVCGYLLLSVSLLSITLLFICDIIVFVGHRNFHIYSNFGFCYRRFYSFYIGFFFFFFVFCGFVHSFFVSYSFIPF